MRRNEEAIDLQQQSVKAREAESKKRVYLPLDKSRVFTTLMLDRIAGAFFLEHSAFNFNDARLLALSSAFELITIFKNSIL